MSKISLVIHYAGLQLPVSKNDKGENVTPLKPISDLFGLLWRDQRKKVSSSASQARRFGVSGGDIPPLNGAQGGDIPPSERDSRGHGPEVFIRIDRVAAYLMSINSEKVRVAGNVDGADFLEKKQEEWADALHDFEELGVAVNMNHAKAQEGTRRLRATWCQTLAVKNKTENAKDRVAISHLMAQMAKELGIPYQPDMLDGGA